MTGGQVLLIVLSAWAGFSFIALLALWQHGKFLDGRVQWLSDDNERLFQMVYALRHYVHTHRNESDMEMVDEIPLIKPDPRTTGTKGY